MDVQTEAWYTTKFGDFIIRPTRFMWASYDRDGKGLVFGNTPEAVFSCTPMHLESKSPEYDGRFSTVIGEAFVGGKL